MGNVGLAEAQMGYGYPPLLCHICPEPCLSASPPSNWQHPAFACPLRWPWDQPPLSRPTSPSQACYHPPWLLPVSRLAAPPQVLHPTAKVQVSFQAGLCPTHLKSPSLTSNANSLTRPSEICCHSPYASSTWGAQRMCSEKRLALEGSPTPSAGLPTL